ncbi:MAG TPA: hypothetical protein DHV26_02790 [Cytophagales bacterium]|nr:hypothetical protein [Cytophagales bacterium]
MKKAELIALKDKKEKQQLSFLELTPPERLEYLIHLIKLTNHFNRKIHTPVKSQVTVLIRKQDVSV